MLRRAGFIFAHVLFFVVLLELGLRVGGALIRHGRTFPPADAALNYGDVIGAIRSYGSRLVMTSYLRADPRLGKLLERIARERGVPFLDLYSTETDRDEYFTEDRFHPNERGHEIIATKLCDLIERERLLPETESTPGTSRYER